eukprot:GILI01026151.1.p1 GENE.GILI01026151.1~~GILI01026151.1.p1  ORF type:complete len:268 (-),score=22.19 GILI01026151.1:55-858(-)
MSLHRSSPFFTQSHIVTVAATPTSDAAPRPRLSGYIPSFSARRVAATLIQNITNSNSLSCLLPTSLKRSRDTDVGDEGAAFGGTTSSNYLGDTPFGEGDAGLMKQTNDQRNSISKSIAQTPNAPQLKSISSTPADRYDAASIGLEPTAYQRLELAMLLSLVHDRQPSMAIKDLSGTADMPTDCPQIREIVKGMDVPWRRLPGSGGVTSNVGHLALPPPQKGKIYCLHKYNEVKDAAQHAFGLLAQSQGVELSTFYFQRGIEEANALQ